MNQIVIKRNINIDILKSISIIGVVIIHVCSGGYSNQIMSFNWLSTVFWGCITRGSVPIFLMCSGALMLDENKDLPIKKLFSKNLLRIIIAMFFWSFFYKFYHLTVAQNISIPSILNSFKEILIFKQEFHLYYLHIMILVYIFVPIIRDFIKNSSKESLKYSLIVWYILGIIYPTIQYFYPINLLTGMALQWKINMAYSAIGYCVLGYYLSKYKLSSKIGVTLGTIGFVSVFGGTVIMSMKNNIFYQNFLEGMSVGVSLLAMGIFIVVYNLKVNNYIANFFVSLSNASFCIYLVHDIYIYIYISFISVNSYFCLISIPLLSVLIIIASYITYKIIDNIPILKKWII